MPAAAPPRPVVDPRTGLRSDGGLEPDRLRLLGTLQEAFAAAVPATDPGARVPTCGDWSVRDLVVHLAGIHHWAAGMAVGDDTRPEDLPAADAGSENLADLYRRHAAELRAALDAAGPDGAARTLVGDGPASFWHRRQVHETLVHLHDLHAARLGSGPAVVADRVLEVDLGIDATVWADTVDEIVTMFQPRQVRLGRMPALAAPVGLVAPDLGWSWTLGAHDDTAAAAGGTGRRRPVATLSAPAHGLALLLWGRLDPAGAGATVDGDEAAVRGVLEAPIVP